MESTVAGDWTGTLRMTGSPDTALTLHLKYAPPGTQTACGNRVLAHSQCIDESTMRLEGTLTTTDKTFTAAPLTGSFSVMGLELSEGQLALSTKDGVALHVTYSKGAFATGQVQKSGGAAAGTFDLRRP